MALKRIRYVGPHPEVEIEWPLPGGRTVVKHGGHVDLPTKLANSFLEQEANWATVVETKPHPKPVEKKDEPAEAPAVEKGDG